MPRKLLQLLPFLFCMNWSITVSCADVAGPVANLPDAKKSYSTPVIIHFDGVIAGRLEHYFHRKIDEALAAKADLLIVQIDSPGGRLDTTFEIAQRLRELKHLRTVAYIPHEAISGAAIVSLACDEIVMHPSARLGDCGPIFLDQDFMFRHAPEKVRSDLAVQVRELAARHGRAPALAEAMVDMNLAVFQVTSSQTGKVTFMSDAEINSSVDRDQWEKGPIVFETRGGNFLTVTGNRACELGLAEAVVQDRAELLKRFGATRPAREMRATWIDTLVYVLNWPTISGLIIVVGLVALYVEFCSPGISLGGGVAFACFAIFFWSRFLGGTSTWLEVILFVCGIMLLGMELFVIPGFGLPGIAGVALIIGSLVMASQDFLIPRSDSQWRRFADSLASVAGAGVACLIIAAVLSRYWKSVSLFRNLAFVPPVPQAGSGLDDRSKATKGKEALGGLLEISVGDWGIAESQLRPAGKARFGPTFVNVLADGSYVDRGQQVKIVRIDGNRITVVPIEES